MGDHVRWRGLQLRMFGASGQSSELVELNESLVVEPNTQCGNYLGGNIWGRGPNQPQSSGDATGNRVRKKMETTRLLMAS